MKEFFLFWLFIVSAVTIFIFLIWLEENITLDDIRSWRQERSARRKERKDADKR